MTSLGPALLSDWVPHESFRIERGALVAPRPLNSIEGVGDRLRAAAFAEVQAEAAFRWAAMTFEDASPELREVWLELAAEERRHLGWLLGRMEELSVRVDERPVSDVLWASLTRCGSAREFCHYMAGAEERGRRAGERFHETLAGFDPVAAEIFGKIAREEARHIALAYEFYPLAPVQGSRAR